MMTLDEIRAALSDRRLTAVSEATGVHRNTLSQIKSGRLKNPSYETITRLSNYLAGRRDAS